MASQRVIVIVGAGPGVSASVARRFASEEYAVGLLGLDGDEVAALAGELEATAPGVATAVVDVTDVDAATRAVDEVARKLGGIDVLHFNPSAFREADPLELGVDELLSDVALGAGALLTAVQAARGHLRTGGRVTVTGSQAADKPWNRAASLGVQKAAVRNLVHSIDTTLAPDVRAVSVTVCGVLATAGSFTPDQVAEAIWGAAHQDEDSWRTEVRYEG